MQSVMGFTILVVFQLVGNVWSAVDPSTTLVRKILAANRINVLHLGVY